mmetsp:Transcript_18028/g.29085  ORF Transcript_18028/g.29085 Transcript_18028/m.29085 type:complete len:102 (+) Transcript_18028:582-887(+)
MEAAAEELLQRRLSLFCSLSLLERLAAGSLVSLGSGRRSHLRFQCRSIVRTAASKWVSTAAALVWCSGASSQQASKNVALVANGAEANFWLFLSSEKALIN